MMIPLLGENDRYQAMAALFLVEPGFKNVHR